MYIFVNFLNNESCEKSYIKYANNTEICTHVIYVSNFNINNTFNNWIIICLKLKYTVYAVLFGR